MFGIGGEDRVQRGKGASVCMESGYLFGTCKEVQVRSGFFDLDGKAEQRAGMKTLKRKVLPPLTLPLFSLSDTL